MSVRKQGNIDPIRDHRVIRAEIDRELHDIGEDLVATAVDYLEKHNIPMSSPGILGSVRSEVEKLKRGWRLQFGANIEHAIFVHEGTRPHWPPEKAIRRWVRLKFNKRGADLERTTFFVRRKISREGTPSKPFLAVAIRAHQQKIGIRIGRAVEKGISRAG